MKLIIAINSHIIIPGSQKGSLGGWQAGKVPGKGRGPEKVPGMVPEKVPGKVSRLLTDVYQMSTRVQSFLIAGSEPICTELMAFSVFNIIGENGPADPHLTPPEGT